MRRLVGVLMFSFCAVGMSGAVFADNAVATVARVGFVQSIGDVLFVEVDPSTINGAPACSVNTQWQFAVSLANAEGQQLMALLLEAKALDATVQFQGTGACDVYNNVETLNAIYF